MTYRKAAQTSGLKIAELKEVFGVVLDAHEEVGLFPEITPELLDLWRYGSPLLNHQMQLDKLNAKELLCTLPGVNGNFAEQVIKGAVVVDNWTLYLAACCHTVGEELPKDFTPTVEAPIQAHLEQLQSDEAKMKLEREKLAKIIDKLRPSIIKVVEEAEKILPAYIAGTELESDLVKLRRVARV